jgi:P4 family phage/plasmid primase-like protien
VRERRIIDTTGWNFGDDTPKSDFNLDDLILESLANELEKDIPVSFTRFTNATGDLSKTYEVIDGKVIKTPAAVLAKGTAERVTVTFLDFMNQLCEAGSRTAFAYGVHPAIYGDQVNIVVNGKQDSSINVLARTKEFYSYSEGVGIMMIDHDPSAYGPTISSEELVQTLEAIHKGFSKSARIIKPSLSSGVVRVGSDMPSKHGFHLYNLVANAADIPRYGNVLFQRLWLMGYGFIALSSNGSLLLRSIIDSAVFSPERLDFVGKPIVSSSELEYKPSSPEYMPGILLDTTMLPDLTSEELLQLEQLIKEEKSKIQPKALKIQCQWREERINDLENKGSDKATAGILVDSFLQGDCKELYADFILDFADSKLGKVSVKQVLDNPQMFNGKSLADPIEGKTYGSTTAKFYWNDGKPVINSFAHGQNTKYFFKEVSLAKNTFNDILEKSEIIINRELTETISEYTPVFSFPTLHGVDVRDGTINTRPLSEMGNSLRLIDSYHNDLFYISTVKSWLVWHDDSWSWDPDAVFVRSYTKELPTQIYNEGHSHLKDADAFVKWSRLSQKQATMTSTISILKDCREIHIPFSVIDSNSYQVGINNARQVIDLKTGVVRISERNDYLTKSLNVEYLGDSARAVRWHAFLDQVFEGDNDLIDWIQRWCGYLLTGSTIEHVFLFCYGLGSNGKNVFSGVLLDILGDYARAIATETVSESKRQAGSATPDLVDLIGARLAISSETEDNVALSESLIKSLVSGDPMSARGLYCAPVQFTPQFKLMMLGNHKPIIRGTDDGIWRRIRLVPFNKTFTSLERDPFLAEKLRKEIPHILAWMVEGCLEWQKNGLQDIPKAIMKSTNEYKVEQDLIGSWVDECCERDVNRESNSTDLYKSYQTWCVDSGLRVASKVAFSRRLAERGFTTRRSNGKTWMSGLVVSSPCHSYGMSYSGA